MPQGGRKVPFSGKAKKQQLQSKKDRKSGTGRESTGEVVSHVRVGKRLNSQPSISGRARANRYALQFKEDSKEEDARRRELARKALNYLPEEALEVDPETPYPAELDFPKRPAWDSSMGRDALEAREQKYLRDFLDDLGKKFDWSELSYFEMNLETWRQLWRVLEMSDIVLFIVDIRFPVYLFPPTLYTYVTETLGKNMILVLNKVDLAPAPLVLAWKHFFLNRYPALQVLMFTAFPGYNLRESSSKPGGLKVRRRKGKQRMAAEGAQQVLQACEKIVNNDIDLSSWHKKIAEELQADFDDECLEVGESIQVVSVSRTPGHTKHFQTIFLTPKVRLCDCPGLVFPSKVPKTLQVLMGSYPIAQLREPFSSVQYLAERLNLVTMLKLQHPENDTEWSAFDICDAWAKQRGFITAKAARLDSYRAANHLLRMALDGKVCLCLYPPQYVAKKDKWEHHGELKEVLKVQAKAIEEGVEDIEDDQMLSSDDEEASSESNASSEASAESDGNDRVGPSTVTRNKFALLVDDD
ncbi:hypothetical protein B566_EDAN004112 [Ephemera danica]|nr:hypothetical protein B566_EDAN004112 [Ephemera danica]